MTGIVNTTGVRSGTVDSRSVTNLTGVLPSDVTGGSGLTALGTVTSGTFEGTLNTDTTYPAFSVLGVFSRNTDHDDTETHVVTGVGFQPSVVHFSSSIQDKPSWSRGASNGSANLCFMTQYNTQNAATPGANTDNKCIYIHHSATAGTKAVAAMNSDGFTLTYFDIGSPGTFAVVTMWTAYR